jgi:putative ABC transport system ATP-binding protein
MQAILEIQNLRFRWPKGQRDILDIAQMSINTAEKVFIKGESGSGKTTLLGLIGGINTANQGEIVMLSQPFSSLNQKAKDRFRADHIGYIFQLFNLIPYLSVIENILLACHFSPSRKQTAIKKSGSPEAEALRLLNLFQLDANEIAKQAVSNLSVGQQQRVAAARALIGSPELIIADEPTSALDADTRENFIQCLLSECKQANSTLLFVSHDSSLEKHFDRSIALNSINHAALASTRGLSL